MYNPEFLLGVAQLLLKLSFFAGYCPERLRPYFKAPGIDWDAWSDQNESGGMLGLAGLAGSQSAEC